MSSHGSEKHILFIRETKTRPRPEYVETETRVCQDQDKDQSVLRSRQDQSGSRSRQDQYLDHSVLRTRQDQGQRVSRPRQDHANANALKAGKRSRPSKMVSSMLSYFKRLLKAKRQIQIDNMHTK